jgi:hypothetical protein
MANNVLLNEATLRTEIWQPTVRPFLAQTRCLPLW